MAMGLQGAGLVLWLAALAACRLVRPASSQVDFLCFLLVIWPCGTGPGLVLWWALYGHGSARRGPSSVAGGAGCLPPGPPGVK